MERLNDIMGRTPQRRQQLSEQQRALQEKQIQDAQSVSPRRLQAEQMMRTGQKYPSQNGQMPGRQRQSPSGQSYYYPHRTRNLQQEQGETNPAYESGSYEGPVSRADYGEYEPTDSRNSLRDSTTAYLQSRSRPSYTYNEQARPQTFQTNPGNEYYPDDYTSQRDADVLEDDYSMIDGDWEKGRDTRIYEDENIAIFEEPAPNLPESYSPSVYRPSSSETEPFTRSTHGTRGLRDQRPGLTYRQQPQSQMPQSRTQEIPHHQRITQPLDPQAMSGIAREREFPRTNASQPSRAVSRAQETPPPLPNVPTTPSAYTPPANTRATCPKCKGAGFLRSNVPFGHPNFGKPVACDCKEAERKEKRRQQLRDMSNMDALRSHNFRTFNSRVPGVQEAFDAALAFAANPEGWLVLVGPNGCGKTHLAAAVANQSLDQGAVVLFEAVPDLLDHLRAAFAPTANEVYDQLFSKMREAELLVLDDLGSQQSSPWANEKLFQLLNYRYNMGMPTVITSNTRALQGADDRIRSRIGDVSLVRNINMDRVRDYRPTNPKRRQ